MKGATIYDVARESGLSIKTVSRVMKHDPTVKDSNRERVERAAEALHYSPNLSARSLAGSRSFLIAAFADSQLTLDHWREGRADYVPRLQLGAIQACRRAGYHFTLELIDHDPAKLQREVRDVMQALRPDGVILTTPTCDDPELLALMDGARVRYARLGSDPTVPGGVQLHLQDRHGAAEVTRHLLDLGHRRIGLIAGPPRYAASHERLAGFRETMEEAGVAPCLELERVGDFTFQSGVDAADGLMALADPPIAIFACNDEMALGCLAALDERGLACPDDISVAGFDDSAGARYSRPRLTTLRQPLAEMAGEAVRLLLDPGGYRPGPAGRSHGCELVVGASTASPRPVLRAA